MSKSIIIAEKPSVARDIARVLGCHNKSKSAIEGPKYIVTWALGHLVTLAPPSAYDSKYEQWSMETLPMIPDHFKLEVISKTSHQFKAIRQILQRPDVKDIIIATDAGREGELVARWIIEYAKSKKPIQRLWISSVTDQAIRLGFNQLKNGHGYDNLYQSAVARAEADWLVGLNASRALTCKHNASLSCGRVQTPTLGMIHTREQRIRQFVSKNLYGLNCQTQSGSFQFLDASGNAYFTEDESYVDQIKEKISGQPLVIQEIVKKTNKVYPPSLYDLTTLQSDANRLYDFSAKETLRSMQSLYETHKVLTYPRTDSKYLTKDILPTLQERLRAIQVGPFKSYVTQVLKQPIKGGSHFVDDSKVSDHHAIIPTEEVVDLRALSNSERKIYDLVIRRFLSVLYPPYIYEQMTAIGQVGQHKFRLQSRQTISLGFKEVLKDSEASELPLISFTKGQSLKVQTLQKVSKQTQPPSRFTEGTLLEAMENPKRYMNSEDAQLLKTLDETGGLGTVATRGDIIEKLFNHNYMEKKGKSLYTTQKGRQILELAPEDLRSPDLTAHWEGQLQLIADGKLKKDTFMRDLTSYTKTIVQAIKMSDATYVHDNATTDKCENCGKPMLLVENKNGRMLVCQDRECGTRKNIARTSNARCPQCHKKLEIVGEGDGQRFVCRCGYREKLQDFKERKEKTSHQMGKRDVQKYLSKDQKQPETFNNPFAALLEKVDKDPS